MTVRPSSAFSITKILIFVGFIALLLAWTLYDYRQGNSMVGPLIIGAFLVAIAIIFKPWKAGSDEGPRPPKPPNTSAFLLAPLFVQDSLGPIPMTEGRDSWTLLAIVVVIGLVIGGIVWLVKRKKNGDPT